MIALRIEFLAGRFHANPWDRSTNDGSTEWPPSPWRLLRALTSAWYRAGQPDRATFLALLDRLSEPPVFQLPRATAGHTRHYMPLGSAKNGRPDTTLVLDSFIRFDSDREHVAVGYVMWPKLDLASEDSGEGISAERTMLERCCALVTYLGRAESWCSITVVDTVEADDYHVPVDLASRSEGAGPTVRRLAPGPSLRGAGLLSSLSEATGTMRKARRLMPRDTAWVEYRLPPDFLMVREQVERPDRDRPAFENVILRFLLERGEHSPKPSIKDAVAFGELLRAAAIRRLSDRTGEAATRRLAGKNPDGTKIEGHTHPYFLPFDEHGRGEIDGFDVWFPSTCTHDEFRALTQITELREHVLYDDHYPLTFIGMIQPSVAKVWSSVTPVALERFPKMRGRADDRRLVDPPIEQLAAMVRRATGREARIDVWEPARGIQRMNGGHIRTDAFRSRRIRKDAKESPALPLVCATLNFDEPVTGPLVLGRLSHFGLGQFAPAV